MGTPVLYAFFRDAFDADFLRGFTSGLDEWGGFEHDSTAEALLDDTVSATGRAGALDVSFRSIDTGIRFAQPGEGSGFRSLPHLRARLDQTEDSTEDRISFVRGLYERATAAGRRPVQTWVTRSTGRYYRYMFSEQSILADRIFDLEWMHVLTPDQIDRFGRDRLESAPAHRLDPVGDSILLVTTPQPESDGTAVERHLGLAGPVGESWYDDLDHDIDHVRERATWQIDAMDSAELNERQAAQALSVPYPRTRWRLLRAIRGIESEPVFEGIAERLCSDEDETVRSEAAVSIATHYNDFPDLAESRFRDRAQRTLSEALWDPSSEVRIAALNGLHEDVDERTADRVAELLASENLEERRAAASSYASNDVDGAGATLLEMVDDPDPEIRISALVLIRNTGPENHQEKVQRCLDDPDPRVRLEAGVICENDRAAIECLASVVLENSDSAPRSTAATRLTEFDDPAARDVLRDLLDDPDEDVRFAAAKSLRSERALECLVNLLTATHRRVWRCAPEELALRDPERAIAALVRNVNDTDPERILSVLQDLANDRSGPEFERHLAGVDQATRQAAARRCEEHGADRLAELVAPSS